MFLKKKYFTAASECENTGTGKQMYRLFYSSLLVKRREQEWCEERCVSLGIVSGTTAIFSEVL